MAAAPAKSTASLFFDSNAKFRIFGTKPQVATVPTPDIKSTEERGGDHDREGTEFALDQLPKNDVELSIRNAPSTPVPPIPSPGEVAAALADAAFAIEEPPEKAAPTQLATTPLPERSVEPPSVGSVPVSSSQSEIPLHNVSRPGINPNTSGEPPANQNKGQKPQIWKATPPERRKTITVEDKTPGA